jgi:mannosyltransferase
VSAAVAPPAGTQPLATARRRALPQWWPLVALLVLAAALRFSTLGLQSFWYDEAFTPVHVLHAGLGATLKAVVHTENTPPLWYVLIWAWSRIFGTGALALRFPSALAGVATVAVAWGIGRELTGRRATAIATAAFVAVNPLFVWYSQEARAYGLFVLTGALAMWCFLRAERTPTPGRLAAFALAASLALLSHYFAAFLLAPMIVMLLLHEGVRRRATLAKTGTDRRSASTGGACLPALVACAVPTVVGLALLPLASAQGGHGAQWIGEWALTKRLQAIPQYYLTGYMGAPLGHGIELLVALPIVAGIGWGLWNVLEPREERGALIALTIAASGVLLPIALVAFGADYLAPRNLVAAMIPVSALIAVVVVARRAGRTGALLAALIALAGLAITVDVDLSPRLQRGDWRGVAKVLRGTSIGDRVITTVELGAAPLEYYLPPLHNLAEGTKVTVSEIDETGYAPLKASAGKPPAAGFRLAGKYDVHGLIVYRFVANTPQTVSEATLRRHVITEAHPEVLVSPQVPL